MPIITMFCGIVIRLYFIDNQQLHLPRLRARYGEFEASMTIAEDEIVAGTLPKKQLRLVQAWIELHRDELVAARELVVQEKMPYKIASL
jgi:hypothetical protein